MMVGSESMGVFFFQAERMECAKALRPKGTGSTQETIKRLMRLSG